MLRFHSIASSSRGNCYAVTDEETGEQLMIEAGVRKRTIKEGFDNDLSRVVGVLISHEHLDHSRNACELARSGFTIYASRGTAEAVGIWGCNILKAGEAVKIGSFTVLPFRTMHDAAEPIGFLIRGTDGDKLLFATDTVSIPVRAKCGIYAVEANYARDLIGYDVPDRVRQRVLRTHMDVTRLCDWLRCCDLSVCREVNLIHLSTASSDEARFVNQVRGAVPHGVRVYACGI